VTVVVVVVVVIAVVVYYYRNYYYFITTDAINVLGTIDRRRRRLDGGFLIVPQPTRPHTLARPAHTFGSRPLITGGGPQRRC